MLKAFPGTVLLVTHNHYLVDTVATQVWMIDDGELRAYTGNYTAYLAAKAEEEAAAAATATPDNGPLSNFRESIANIPRRRCASASRSKPAAAKAHGLAELIKAMEQRLAGLGEEFGQASAAQDTRRVEALGHEYQAVDDRLHQLMEEWAALAT